MEFTLLGAAALGVAGLYGVLWNEARHGNAADCTRDLWDVALGAAVAGLLVGRLAAMAVDGVNPLTNPGDVLIVRAGVDTGFASATAIVTLALLSRRETVVVADALAAATLSGLAGWHAGCLLRDACAGTPSDLPWAITLNGSEITRHPEGLYTALAFLVAAVALAAWKRRVPPAGMVAGVGLALAGSIRLVTEPFRPSLGSRPVGWYVAALVAGVVAALLAATRRYSR